jgi:hypothetical protein
MTKKKKKGSKKDAEIGRTEAEALVAAYRDNRYGKKSLLTENLSMYAEFELATLISYLVRMKDKHEATRVRIYYGAQQKDLSSTEKAFIVTPVLVTTKGSKPYQEIFLTNKRGEEKGALAAIPKKPDNAYDFASLCPPDATHIKADLKSLAFDVYKAKKKSSTSKVAKNKRK